jgi:excisionase family DNA binding protein
MSAVYLSLSQTAERLNLSGGTVRNEIKSGRLRAYRFRGAYRIEEGDLAEYIRSCRLESREPEAKPPAPGPTTLKHLDGARLRAAWNAQGILAPQKGGGSARSSGLRSDQSDEQLSLC